MARLHRDMQVVCVIRMRFQVLSIRTALSIQSHPDKQLAEQLHAERPEAPS